MLTFQARGHQNALFWMQIFKKNAKGRARGRFAPPAPPSQTKKLEPPPNFFLATPLSMYNISFLLPLDEAVASRAVTAILSGSNGRAETLLEPARLNNPER